MNPENLDIYNLHHQTRVIINLLWQLEQIKLWWPKEVPSTYRMFEIMANMDSSYIDQKDLNAVEFWNGCMSDSQ